jgi:predicted DNA-binding protein YlxM (UPF0122 family)
MTTVGYGDYFTKSIFGNFAAICAIFIGAIAAALFTLVCFDQLSMDKADMASFKAIQKNAMHDEMKKVVVAWLSCEVKIKSIKQIRKASRNKLYAEMELYHLQSQAI